MSNESDFKIYFSKSKDGTFLAATNQSPFFCFEGETQAAAEALVVEAFKFLSQATEQREQAVRTHEVSIAPFVANKVLRKRELVAA